MEIHQEIWQVEVNGQIYEAPFGELPDWIAEGSLLPGDRVRKGELRWLEAGKIPSLVKFFNAKVRGELHPAQVSQNAPENLPAAPPQATHTAGNPMAAPAEANPYPAQNPPNAAPAQSFTAANPVNPAPQTNLYSLAASRQNQGGPGILDQNTCSFHPSSEAIYICQGCSALFCKACPKSYGNVKICSSCGAMCRGIGEHSEKTQKAQRYSRDIDSGFGLSDLGNAISYPFKHPSSLFFGALFYAIFEFGRSASGVGSIYLIFSAIICGLLANMLIFGCLANTAEEFSQGNTEAGFMPDFGSFSIWEHVVHPFFLMIGVNLISFGLSAVFVVCAIYFSLSAIGGAPSSNINFGQPDMSQSAPMSEEARRMQEQLDQFAEMQRNKVPGQLNPAIAPQTAPGMAPPPLDTERSVMEAQKLIDETRKAQIESTIGKSPETLAQERNTMIQAVLSNAFPFIVLAALAGLLGLFYYPAACMVAAYTRSFAAVINPAVGFDTIRRLGSIYLKVFLITILIAVVAGVFETVIAGILSPFDMPRVGNIPAAFIGAFFDFYFYIVFAAVLGYALYKGSGKLDLYRA